MQQSNKISVYSSQSLFDPQLVIIDTVNELIYKFVRLGFKMESSIFNEIRHL